MKLKKRLKRWAKGLVHREARLPALNPRAIALARNIREQKLTYLPQRKLERLARICEIARHLGVSDQLFIETGCALGGSSILIGKEKPKDAPLRVHDVFGLIPKPSANDDDDVHRRFEKIEKGAAEGLGGDPYYGYQENLYDRVVANFQTAGLPLAENNIRLVKGLVQDTLVVDAPVFLAHIDVDWYDPVMTCLERITPKLAPHGFLVLDDYLDWSGCRKAVDAYFRDRSDSYIFDQSARSLTITRRDNPWRHALD